MYCYTIYEWCEKEDKYKITDKANLELTDLDEAKAEVEHCLPLYIDERDWTEGDSNENNVVDTHWLIQHGLVDAMVCLGPTEVIVG